MVTAKRAAKPNASKEELLHYYREMLLIRRFEEKAGQLYGMGLINGFCHLYIGQEAVVVGLEAAAKKGEKWDVKKSASDHWIIHKTYLAYEPKCRPIWLKK